MKKAIVPLGLIVLLVFGIFIYANRFTLFMVSDVDGYAFNSDTMVVNLSNGLNQDSQKITYENVNINENIYQSGKKYYIGEKEKKNINLNYPIVSEDKTSLVVLSEMGNYIDSTFLKSTAYKNTILSEGYLYNGNTYERADESNYIFLELNNGLYVNLVEITIRRDGKDHKIPINSFIYFDDSFARYYTLENKEYRYNEIAGIQNESKVYIGKDKYSYYNFLIYIGVLKEKEPEKEEIIEEIEIPEEEEEYIPPEQNTSDVLPPTHLNGSPIKPSGGVIVREDYVKPEARINNTEAGVYTFRGDLDIYDPKTRIYKAPTLEFSTNGQVFLRTSFNQTMRFESVGLMPNTTYDVVAYYYYHNENDQKVKNTFYKGTFTTKDIDSLEVLKMNIDEVIPDVEQVKIKGIHLENEADDEVLKGLKTGNIDISGKTMRISAGDIQFLQELEKVDYETDKVLTSNTSYDAEIKLIDIAGNELVIEGNKFNFSTLKSPPRAKISVNLSKNFTLATVKINVTNPDDMIVSNFRYSVFDGDGNLLTASQNGTGPLELGNNTIELKNLYAETKYIIKVNCDYTDSLGETFNNHLMDQYEFISYDVSRLGAIPFTVNVKDVTQSTVELGIQYTNYNPDDPIYSLISEDILLKVYNAENPDEYYTQTYNKSVFQNPITVLFPESLQDGGLKSNTVYKVELVPQIKSGPKTYNVETTLKGISEFQTLKVDANVYIKNGFVANNFIDFDVCVEDTDNAIKQPYAFVKVMDYSESENGEAVYSQQVAKQTSCAAERDSLVYERVQATGIENKNYKIEVQALEYNTTHGDAGLTSNFVMRQEDISVTGTTGSMQLESLINKINYETSIIEGDTVPGELEGLNLFDISNNTRWKSSGHQNTIDRKQIKIDSNEVELIAHKGWRMYSYYVPELANRTYTVSFNFTYVKGTTTNDTQQICITYDDSSNCNKNITSLLTDSSRRVSVTVPARNSKYLSFRINESASAANETILTLKDVKIELGDVTDTTYSEFGGYDYQTVYAGTFNTQFVNLIDGENGIVINEEKELKFNHNSNYKYVVRYFMNNEVVEEMTRYLDISNSESPDPNVLQSKYIVNDIIADVSYEARLGVEVIIDDGNGEGITRYYDLKTVEFTSEAETRTIESIADYKNMHMYGYYLVNADLDFTAENSGYYSGTFQGTIDFQGHKVTVAPGVSSSYIMSTLGGGGIIKNLDMHYKFTKPETLTNYYGIVDTNYGLISNLRLVVDETVQPTRVVQVQDGTKPCPTDEDPNKTCPNMVNVVENTGHNYISLMCEENYGTIENFQIILNAPMYLKSGSALGPISNAGTMKNGYAVGKYNIEAGFTNDNSEKSIGVIARTSSTNSRIENIYSMIDVNLSDILTYANDYKVANIVYSASNALIKNVMYIDPRLVHTLDPNFQYETNYRKHSEADALIYNNSGSSIENIYYIGNDLYKNPYTQDATISHLSNESFMSARLNSERKFNTVEAWGISVFPHLIWPATMPAQDYYNVPKKNASDMLKILSIDSVIQDKNDKNFDAKYKDEYFARVEMSIYNPQNAKVAGFQMAGLGDSNDTVNKPIKVASQTAGNSDKIAIVVFYVKEPTNFKSKYQVTDIYLNARNGDNNISGLTKSCTNNKITTEYNCLEKPILEMELYKYVSTVEEIVAAQNAGHENFRLSNDLTFAEGDPTKEIPTLTGVLDGDGHTISGLTSNNCFVRNLSGTIKNLKINNYKVIYSASDYKNYGALICKATTGSIVDNVHVKDISTTAGGTDSLYISGLVANAVGANIRNSSVSNMQVEGISAMKDRNAYAGGLVAYAKNTNITTSFARNLKLKLLSYVKGDAITPDTYGVSKYLATGGIVGLLESGVIENVYATGEIDTQFGTVGGIVGETKGFVRSAISRVNIYTIGDEVGGIIGKVATDNSNIASKTLVLGDILTSAEKFYNLDRTSGSPLTANQNFAWNRQSINSIVSANTKMEELLDDTELSNPVIYSSKIGLSNIAFAVDINNYNKKYDARGNLVAEDTQYGILPKLLHSTTGKILDNQDVGSDTEVHYVELFSLLGNPVVEYWSKGNDKNSTSDDYKVTDPWNGEYVKVKLQLKNPNEFEITEVLLSDMTMTEGSLKVSSVQGDKSTWNVSFNAQADLNKNYDSYKITGVRYAPNANEFKLYRTTIKLVIPFYGRIESAEDWQLIKQGTYQNFVLANDIDLSEYSNAGTVNYKLSFNKLIGLEVKDATTGEMRNPKIMNFSKTGARAGDCVLDTIVSDLKNVSFENITLKASSGASGNYFGVVKFLNGNMLGELNQSTNTYKRMYFKNIHIDGQSISYVGIVALNKAPNIKYIQIDDVISMGNQRVGSFIGSSYCVDKVDIIANRLYVYGKSSYVGGFIGYENHNWSKTFTTNVKLNGVYVKGGSYTGGFGGYASGREIYVTGSTDVFNGQALNQVRGSTYTGGIAGQYSSCYPYYNYSSHLNIYGGSRVGGICGYRWNVYYAKGTNNYVNGSAYVGGISGESGYTALYCTVQGGTITGDAQVGGISGYVSWGAIYDCHVGSHNGEVVKITGRNGSSSYDLGGIVGYVTNANNSIYNNQVSAVITGGYQIGGVVGRMPNRSESSSNYRQRFYQNTVANCVIKATNSAGYVGGLVGRIEKPLQYNYIYKNLISVTISTAGTNYIGYVIGGSNYSYNVTNKVTNEDGTTTNVTTTITYNETKGDNYLHKEENGKVISNVNNIYLFENSTLNTVSYKNAAASGNTIQVKTITEAQMRTWDIYASAVDRGRMLRASSESNKSSGLEYFPYMRYAQNASTALNSITTNLPGTVSAAQSLEFAGIPEYHILPDFQVYAVDVDKINIEFKEVDPHSYFTINGTKYQITQNVFTFYYDFKEDFTVKIEDNYNFKEVEVTVEDVKNGVSVIGEYYYYLKDGEVITNRPEIPKKDETTEEDKKDETTEEDTTTEEQPNEEIVEEENSDSGEENSSLPEQPVQNEIVTPEVTPEETPEENGELVGVSTRTNSDIVMRFEETDTKTVVENATNIYGTEILLDNQNIYDIETGKTKYNSFDNLTLAEEKPLHEFVYANQEIETYFYYTTINGKKINKQVYVKNGQIEVIEQGVNNKKNQIMVDNYNDKNYLIYLGGDGKLYSLKDDIVFPENFKNVNIKSISSNISTNTDIMMVEYNDGSYTVFNYRTGQLLVNHSDEPISLTDYVKQSIEISVDSTKAKTNKNYESAKKLTQMLNKKPLEVFTNGDSVTTGGVLDGRTYTIVYNPGNEKYEVYKLPTKDDSGRVLITESLNKSMDSIIDQDTRLIEYYRGKTYTTVEKISSIMITLAIILGIAGAVLALGKFFSKNKNSEA